MPKISRRGQVMPESPIRKLVPYAEEAKRKGRIVYHLNIGQPDIRTPKNVIKAIKEVDIEVIEYTHSAGTEKYRRGLAEFYNKQGIEVGFEDIIITTGGSEAVLFGLMSCFDPGDEVIIPEPFYANYNSFSRAAGVNVKPITTKIDDGFGLPDPSQFKRLITPRTKGILICNPGNPTGTLYSTDTLNKLRDIVKKHNLFLFSDEVYREFCYDGEKHMSILNLEGIEDNAVVIDSVSKRYSMCGVRIGALISRNKQVMETVLKFAQARLSPPTFGQIAGQAALDTPPEYFQEVIDEYKDRRDILVDGMNSIPGVKCPKPGGAFYAFAELPVDDSEKFCQWLLEEFDYNNQTVMLAPASGFYATPYLGKKQVRIAYVLKPEFLRKSIECLKVALQEYPGTVFASNVAENSLKI